MRLLIRKFSEFPTRHNLFKYQNVSFVCETLKEIALSLCVLVVVYSTINSNIIQKDLYCLYSCELIHFPYTMLQKTDLCLKYFI